MRIELKKKNMLKNKKYRKYSKSLKSIILDKYFNQNKSSAEILKEHDIPISTLYYWINKHAQVKRIKNKDTKNINKIKNGVIHTYLGNYYNNIQDVAREYNVSPEKANQWIEEMMESKGFMKKEKLEEVNNYLKEIDTKLRSHTAWRNKIENDIQDMKFNYANIGSNKDIQFIENNIKVIEDSIKSIEHKNKYIEHKNKNLEYHFLGLTESNNSAIYRVYIIMFIGLIMNSIALYFK